MQIIKLDSESAKKLIDSGVDCYLVISHDLEHDISIGRRKMDKRRCSALAMNSKTIVLNQDADEDDSFSTLSLYSALQRDIFHIEPKGVKHDMILFSPIFNKNQ